MTTTRSRLGSLLAVTALLGALTACGGDSDAQTTPSPTSSASAAASPSASTSTTASALPTVDVDPDSGKFDYCKDQKPFTGPAAKEFGAENVAAAYCTYATLMMEKSFIESYMKNPVADLKAIDFSGWEQYMTSDAKDDWQAMVGRFLSDKMIDGDYIAIAAFTYVNILGDGASYEFTDEPAVLNQAFSAATSSVDTSTGEKRLNLLFDVSADLNAVKAGTQNPYYLIPLTKTIELALVENPAAASDDTRWLIDGWSAVLDLGDARKRPALTTSK